MVIQEAIAVAKKGIKVPESKMEQNQNEVGLAKIGFKFYSFLVSLVQALLQYQCSSQVPFRSFHFAEPRLNKQLYLRFGYQHELRSSDKHFMFFYCGIMIRFLLGGLDCNTNRLY